MRNEWPDDVSISVVENWTETMCSQLDFEVDKAFCKYLLARLKKAEIERNHERGERANLLQKLKDTGHAAEMKEVLEALRDMPSRGIPDYGEAKAKHDTLEKYRHYLETK